MTGKPRGSAPSDPANREAFGPAKLVALTALTMTAFAANSILNRLAVADGGIDPVAFAVIRLVAGAVMLAALIGRRRLGRSGAVWPGWTGVATGVPSLLLYLFGFSLAYGVLDAGTGALILFGMVQITMFAGAYLRKEPLPARRGLGAALAFLGLVYLLAPGSGAGGSPVHAALMAAAGIGWGVYSLSARGTPDPVGATARNFILAVPAGIVLGALLTIGSGAAPATAGGIALAVVSGALTSALGYALWYAVLPSLGAARAAVAQLTVPVIAAFGGVVFLGEAVTLRFILSALLVLGGVALSVTSRR